MHAGITGCPQPVLRSNKRPIHQVRIGRIKVAVFDNREDAPREVLFTALYTDRET